MRKLIFAFLTVKVERKVICSEEDISVFFYKQKKKKNKFPLLFPFYFIFYFFISQIAAFWRLHFSHVWKAGWHQGTSNIAVNNRALCVPDMPNKCKNTSRVYWRYSLTFADWRLLQWLSLLGMVLSHPQAFFALALKLTQVQGELVLQRETDLLSWKHLADWLN